MDLNLHTKRPLFHTGFRKTHQMLSFITISPVGAEMSHADGRSDRHDEANSRFSQFCERA